MRRGDGAETETPKVLAVFLGDGADCAGGVGGDGACLRWGLCSSAGVCVVGGRLMPYREWFGQENPGSVVDHVQGICVRKMIGLVDPERGREIVEPGFQVQKTQFEKGRTLVLVEAGFGGPPAVVSCVDVVVEGERTRTSGSSRGLGRCGLRRSVGREWSAVGNTMPLRGWVG